MRKLYLICLLLFTTFSLDSPAQSPARIDVTSLTIYNRPGSSRLTSMTATGLPAPYQSPLDGFAEGWLYQLENSLDSRIGDTFPTNFSSQSGAGNFFSGFRLASFGESHRVKFTAEGTSAPIELSPRIPLRKRVVTVAVEARFKGRIEIFNGNTLVAVDDDVDLTGEIKASFRQLRRETQNSSRRAFDRIDYTLSYSR